jgi:lysyl-tRNA synthetase class 2
MNANGKKYYLRLTSEIRLKQLIAAGFEKVFEIGKSFRNEGSNGINNPEFSLLELYSAYQNCEDIAVLVEKILSQSIQEVFKKKRFDLDNGTVDFSQPWPRISLEDIGIARFGNDFSLSIGKDDLLALVRNHWDGSKDAFNERLSFSQIFWDLIEKVLAPNICRPTFVTSIPSVISPLSKESAGIKGASDRMLLVINGIPIADFYTDENWFDIIKPKLEAQTETTGKSVNPVFLHALGCGLPPTAGCGMGIDRLLLCLRPVTMPKHISEVILFPNV